MKSIETGGPAFPIPEAVDGVAPGFGGMSLRDYFAAKAMQGSAQYAAERNCQPEDVAKACYAMADAMLAAREKGGAA